MDQLEVKLGLLVEELTSLDGLMSDEQLLPGSSVLYSVSDVENAVNEVFPTRPHHQSERHSLRRCLRHLNRCLTQLQEIQESTNTVVDSKSQSQVVRFSDRLQNNLISLIIKLKLPFDDDYALELTAAVLNLSAELLIDCAALLLSPENLRIILRRTVQYGEEHQSQRRKFDASKHSICLPWLKILTRQWEDLDYPSQTVEERSSPRDYPTLFPLSGTFMQCSHDLKSAIRTASVLFTEADTVSDMVLFWHNLVVLMIRQLFRMSDSHSSHLSSIGLLSDINDKGSIQGLGQNTQLLSLGNDIEVYIHDLVEMTLDRIDVAMSIRSCDKLNLPSDKASIILGLETSVSTNDSSSSQIVYVAVKLAVIASDAIEVFATSSHFKLQSTSTLPAKLWKGLATAFVTEIDLSFADNLEVSFCASVLSVAEVCLAIDIESVPNSTLLITFLRSLKFPDLLLESHGLWGAMKHKLEKNDDADLKHGLQAAALKIQQSITYLASASKEDASNPNIFEKNAMLKSVIKRIADIMPRNASSASKSGPKQTADPWDEYFWRFMSYSGTNGSESKYKASS